MLAYIVRRFLQAIIVLIGVSFISFAVMFLTGDPIAAMAGEDWTQEMIENLRHKMGYDRPFLVQYFDFLTDVVQGDLGTSLRQKQPNLRLILDRMPATLELAAASFLISIVISIPVGVFSALKHGSWQDNAIMVLALLGQSTPVFWLGIMLILVFSVRLRITPVSGRDGLGSLILPATTLAAFSTARNARMMRSAMLEVMGEDYVRTARAKGLTERMVVFAHVLRNALLPVVTVIGLQIGLLLSGAVITETIFAWPGVGRLVVQAVTAKDIPLVQASVMVIASFFVLINLVVDISYSFLDPRIRMR
jgi:peptide/nickel transport system permease protein